MYVPILVRANEHDKRIAHALVNDHLILKGGRHFLEINAEKSVKALSSSGKKNNLTLTTLGTRVKRARSGKADFNKCNTGKGKN